MTLKERRIQAGMTQEQVAKLVDVDQAAVSHWERGKWLPLPKYQKKLAKLFRCTVDELIGGD